ncbi:MAG: hypothetical protein AAGB22_04875, partial [Bacteroidota bacterium]
MLLISPVALYATDYYWVATDPGNWNDAGNWASTSGGAGGFGVPGTFAQGNPRHRIQLSGQQLDQ